MANPYIQVTCTQKVPPSFTNKSYEKNFLHHLHIKARVMTIFYPYELRDYKFYAKMHEKITKLNFKNLFQRKRRTCFNAV